MVVEGLRVPVRVQPWEPWSGWTGLVSDPNTVRVLHRSVVCPRISPSTTSHWLHFILVLHSPTTSPRASGWTSVCQYEEVGGLQRRSGGYLHGTWKEGFQRQQTWKRDDLMLGVLLCSLRVFFLICFLFAESVVQHITSSQGSVTLKAHTNARWNWHRHKPKETVIVHLFIWFHRLHHHNHYIHILSLSLTHTHTHSHTHTHTLTHTHTHSHTATPEKRVTNTWQSLTTVSIYKTRCSHALAQIIWLMIKS